MKYLTKRSWVRVPGVILLLSAFLVILAGCGADSQASTTTTAAPAATPTVSDVGNVSFPFSATAVQGPESGKSIKGDLKFKLRSNGAFDGSIENATGDLAAGQKTIPVSGSMKGQLIGLVVKVGDGKSIFGSGIISYNSSDKSNELGGTFTGPSDTTIGVWRGKLINALPTGGCIEGILVEGTHLCYIVT